MIKKVLITGGAGFIGSNLTEYLLKKNIDVKIIDNFTTGKKENIISFISEIEILKGDILDQQALKKILKNIDAVVHLAAIPSVIESIKNPLKVSLNNILGTINLFDTIAKNTDISKIIQASSSAVYGEGGLKPIKETKKSNPLSPYAIDKLTQEFYGYFFSNQYNIDITSFRFFNVFGPKQDPNSIYSGVIPIFIDRIRNKKSPIIFGDGEAIRDFIFVKDISKGIYKSLITSLKNHKIFNLGTGVSTSINELAHSLMSLMNQKYKIIYERPRLGEIKKSLANISIIDKIINFSPSYSLNDGLKILLNSKKNKIGK